MISKPVRIPLLGGARGGFTAGFTLIELLAGRHRHHRHHLWLVAAGALTGQAKALGVACINNQRQLLIAWRLYADDNNDVRVANNPAKPFLPDRPVMDRTADGMAYWSLGESPD